MTRAWMLVLGGLIACGGDKAADPEPDTAEDSPVDDTAEDAGVDGDPATVPLTGACPMETDLGGFVVEEVQTYSYVDGAVLEAIIPTQKATVLAEAGDCRLLRRENPLCDPTCGPEETCDLTGTCVPFPVEQDIGEVVVAGLVQPVVMEAREPGAHYFDTTVPHPAMTDGSLVQLRTDATGALGEVVLHGVAPVPLVAQSDELLMGHGQALEVRWEPPPAGARTEVFLSLNIDQHGGSPGRIECTFADDGLGEVPAELTGGLVDAGVTGFPSAVLRRRTSDRAELDATDRTTAGCIDFQLTSPRTIPLRVSGYIPCTDDDDCPDGQTCNEEIELCQ